MNYGCEFYGDSFSGDSRDTYAYVLHMMTSSMETFPRSWPFVYGMSMLLSSSEETRDPFRCHPITVRSRYIAVNFLCVTHEKHLIAREKHLIARP